MLISQREPAEWNHEQNHVSQDLASSHSLAQQQENYRKYKNWIYPASGGYRDVSNRRIVKKLPQLCQ